MVALFVVPTRIPTAAGACIHTLHPLAPIRSATIHVETSVDVGILLIADESGKLGLVNSYVDAWVFAVALALLLFMIGLVSIPSRSLLLLDFLCFHTGSCSCAGSTGWLTVLCPVS